MPNNLLQQAVSAIWAAAAVLARLVESRSPWDQWQSTLRETLGPPLKAMHEPVDAWLGSLPMSVAMACVLGLYFIALVWVWVLRREFVFRGAPDQERWRDLRVWATVVILPYIAVYWWLGR